MFLADVIIHVENLKYYTQKHRNTDGYKSVKAKDEFNKIVGYKINTQKSFVVLYHNNEQSEKYNYKKQFHS